MPPASPSPPPEEPNQPAAFEATSEAVMPEEPEEEPAKGQQYPTPLSQCPNDGPRRWPLEGPAVPFEAEEAAELEAAAEEEEEEAEPEAPVEVKRILLRPQASQSWNAEGCGPPAYLLCILIQEKHTLSQYFLLILAYCIFSFLFAPSESLQAQSFEMLLAFF
jgi:hypothetical protein